MLSRSLRFLHVVGLLLVGAAMCLGQTPAPPPASRPAASPKEMVLALGDKVALKLVEIPAGKFLMGSPETDKDRGDDETQHEVTISQPFYMGITHVTVDQFAAFVKDSTYKTDAEIAYHTDAFEIKDGIITGTFGIGCSWRNPSFDQKGDHPVVQVSWNDAQAFCAWLSKKSGKTVGLPTEAQWEYACRAGTKTAYPWGDNPDDGIGWANGADQCLHKQLPNTPIDGDIFNWNDGFVFTSPVASFKANAFGLFDMPGNVWQWCQDGYGFFDKGAATDPTGAATEGQRVMRGGSWDVGSKYHRSANRNRIYPRFASYFIGFRVVVVAAAGK